MTEGTFAPPMLARGSYHPNSGLGCIMNLVCWTQGIAPNDVDDEPLSVDAAIRELLISVNDTICTHLRLHPYQEKQYTFCETLEDTGRCEHVEDSCKTEHVGYSYALLNCPACSILLIDWAFAVNNSAWLQQELSKEEYREFITNPLEELHTLLDRMLAAVSNQQFPRYDPKHIHKDIAGFTGWQCYAIEGVQNGSYFDTLQTTRQGIDGRKLSARRRSFIKKMDAFIDSYLALEDKYHPERRIKFQIDLTKSLLPETLEKYGITAPTG